MIVKDVDSKLFITTEQMVELVRDDSLIPYDRIEPVSNYQVRNGIGMKKDICRWGYPYAEFSSVFVRMQHWTCGRFHKARNRDAVSVQIGTFPDIIILGCYVN